jgi:hypothetical protein
MSHNQQQIEDEYEAGSNPLLTAYLAKLRVKVRSQYTPAELRQMDEATEIRRTQREQEQARRAARAAQSQANAAKKQLKDSIRKICSEADWQIFRSWGSANAIVKRRFLVPRAEMNLDQLQIVLDWVTAEWGHLLTPKPPDTPNRTYSHPEDRPARETEIEN